MTRIAIGGILTECNHLGGIPIDLATYEATELSRGEEMLEATTSVVGGMLSVLRETDTVETLPLLFASACAGGPITAECYALLRDELLERFDQVLPVDGVLLPLHGAALAEGLDDPEGDIIRAVRTRVGPDVPIVVTLDLHANITAEMVSQADALLAWETYPHHDQYPTGERGARLLLETLAGRCRPTMAMAKVPVITSAVHGSTNDEDPFADLMRYTKSLEDEPGVLSTSLLLVHPYMDVEGMGSGGLVITDGDQDRAEALATAIAKRYWDRRHDLEPETFSPGEAIQQGLAITGGPVILVETADCCGGGAAGDSIASLQALIDAGVEELSFVPVVDAEAAAACHAAGQGTEITLALGHKRDARWGTPQTYTGVVTSLHDGEFTYTGGQWEGHPTQMGPTAVLSIGALRVLITSRATYDWKDEQFQSVGLAPEEAKFIVAKNPMNYRWAYGTIAQKTIVLDTPGPTPATLKHVKFQKLGRPYFPADLDIPDLEPTLLV